MTPVSSAGAAALLTIMVTSGRRTSVKPLSLRIDSNSGIRLLSGIWSGASSMTVPWKESS